MEHFIKDVNVFNLVLMTLGFLLARTLNKIDRNQTTLFERMTKIEHDFYELRGEHRERLKRGDRP